MKLLVSACLLGVPCRYDGKAKIHEGVCSLLERHTLIPFCPEVYGGLPTPRAASERAGERVVTKAGQEVTEQFRRGAVEALRLCRLYGCRAALLKERSPSCGHGVIHNGLFDGRGRWRDGGASFTKRHRGVWRKRVGKAALTVFTGTETKPGLSEETSSAFCMLFYTPRKRWRACATPSSSLVRVT